jgi:GNAT superfamily N-acetyltransferase
VQSALYLDAPAPLCAQRRAAPVSAPRSGGGRFRVRRATVEDLPEVASFELSYIREIEPASEAAWKDAIPTLLRQWVTNLSRMFVAELGVEPVGHCFWLRDGETAVLASVYVSPPARGDGCGRLLLETFERDAADHGFRRLALQVHRTNSARRLYVGAGYRPTQPDGDYDCYGKVVGESAPRQRPPAN